MIKKKRNEISEIYRKVYPKLENHYVILLSEVFILPTLKEFTDAVERHSVIDIEYVSNITDCEKLAWYLVNGIQRERSEKATSFPEGERITWSVGWTTGIIQDFIQTQSHTLVTALTSDSGIVLLDPLNNKTRKVDEEDFSMILLVM